MIDVLNIKDWIQKSADAQFTTLNGLLVDGGTLKVRRIKDGCIFYVGDFVKKQETWFRVWYFHPDMKSVELVYVFTGSTHGAICEINELIHPLQQTA